MVFDGSGNAFKLAAPVECKGIVGSDDRSLRLSFYDFYHHLVEYLLMFFSQTCYSY